MMSSVSWDNCGQDWGLVILQANQRDIKGKKKGQPQICVIIHCYWMWCVTNVFVPGAKTFKVTVGYS